MSTREVHFIAGDIAERGSVLEYLAKHIEPSGTGPCTMCFKYALQPGQHKPRTQLQFRNAYLHSRFLVLFYGREGTQVFRPRDTETDRQIPTLGGLATAFGMGDKQCR